MWFAEHPLKPSIDSVHVAPICQNLRIGRNKAFWKGEVHVHLLRHVHSITSWGCASWEEWQTPIHRKFRIFCDCLQSQMEASNQNLHSRHVGTAVTLFFSTPDHYMCVFHTVMKHTQMHDTLCAKYIFLSIMNGSCTAHHSSADFLMATQNRIPTCGFHDSIIPIYLFL